MAFDDNFTHMYEEPNPFWFTISIVFKHLEDGLMMCEYNDVLINTCFDTAIQQLRLSVYVMTFK